jgi:hypothetical protein
MKLSSAKKTLLVLAAFVILVYIYRPGLLGKAGKYVLRTLACMRREAASLFLFAKKMGK